MDCKKSGIDHCIMYQLGIWLLYALCREPYLLDLSMCITGYVNEFLKLMTIKLAIYVVLFKMKALKRISGYT